MLPMKPALAKASEPDTLEEVGRATLQVVHDLKNQLNGLKLYATFLRKRMEQTERAQEERETLNKLIAGLDRAARDMTALVRYAKPMEIRCQPHVDLRKLVMDNIRAASTQHGKSDDYISCEIDETDFRGQFDALALSQAIAAITEQSLVRGLPNDRLSVRLQRADTEADGALVEWQQENTRGFTNAPQSFEGHANVHTALAVKIIKAHGGRVEFEPKRIRAWLPLSR